MAKKNENRVLVSLVCEDCKSQNYTVSKNKKNTTDRLVEITDVEQQREKRKEAGDQPRPLFL